jgi:ketosteroid isomerase-like protein
VRAVAVAVAVVAAACGGPSKPAPTVTVPVASAPNPELTPALEPVAWLLGDWHGDAGATEHTVAAGGTVYTVYFNGDGNATPWGVRIIDDGDGDSATADGIRRLLTVTPGEGLVDASETTFEAGHVAYFQTVKTLTATIDLKRDGDTLVQTLLIVTSSGLKMRGAKRMTATADPSAPELEAADRAFDADTAARGVDGWVAAFAPDGALVRGHDWIAGGAAIAANLDNTHNAGHLRWSPIASRVHGDLGFTVGTATWTANDTTEPAWRGSYVTIWGRQPDGSWKVVMDTGRTAQPPK